MMQSPFTEQLLTMNEWSRPGSHLRAARAIVLHWYMVPRQTARQVWTYWESRRNGGLGYGSAHIIVDDTQTLLAIPLDEMAYHVGAPAYSRFAREYVSAYPNDATIGIELAHADLSGKPSVAVWERARAAAAYLCAELGVPPNMIVTHWDITGMRPQWNGIPDHPWFVREPGELARFRHEVEMEVSV